MTGVIVIGAGPAGVIAALRAATLGAKCALISRDEFGGMASILKSEFGDPTKDRRVVFGVYDLGSRRVHVSVPSDDGSGPAIRLMEAPMGREEFRQFAFQVASSAFMTELLHR